MNSRADITERLFEISTGYKKFHAYLENVKRDEAEGKPFADRKYSNIHDGFVTLQNMIGSLNRRYLDAGMPVYDSLYSEIIEMHLKIATDLADEKLSKFKTKDEQLSKQQSVASNGFFSRNNMLKVATGLTAVATVALTAFTIHRL